MNFKCIEGRTGWWRVKASKPWWTSQDCFSGFPFADASVLRHLHNTLQQSGWSETPCSDLRHWNARGLLRCVSWHCSKGGNEDQAEKKPWWILGWGQASLCPRAFLLGGLNLKHIMGYSLEFLHSKHFPLLNSCICVGTILNQFDTLSSWAENAEFGPEGK